jgi:hypothetical protein
LGFIPSACLTYYRNKPVSIPSPLTGRHKSTALDLQSITKAERRSPRSDPPEWQGSFKVAWAGTETAWYTQGLSHRFFRSQPLQELKQRGFPCLLGVAAPLLIGCCELPTLSFQLYYVPLSMSDFMLVRSDPQSPVQELSLNPCPPRRSPPPLCPRSVTGCG